MDTITCKLQSLQQRLLDENESSRSVFEPPTARRRPQLGCKYGFVLICKGNFPATAKEGTERTGIKMHTVMGLQTQCQICTHTNHIQGQPPATVWMVFCKYTCFCLRFLGYKFSVHYKTSTTTIAAATASDIFVGQFIHCFIASFFMFLFYMRRCHHTTHPRNLRICAKKKTITVYEMKLKHSSKKNYKNKDLFLFAVLLSLYDDVQLLLLLWLTASVAALLLLLPISSLLCLCFVFVFFWTFATACFLLLVCVCVCFFLLLFICSLLEFCCCCFWLLVFRFV